MSLAAGWASLAGVVTAAAVRAEPSTAPAGRPHPQLASPWADRSHLEQVVWADLYGLTALPVSRAEAMAVPAIARARHILAGTIARLPLRALRGGDLVDPQPTWLTRAQPDAVADSPWLRMLWTVDDLIFHGEALWQVVRGADTFPVAAWRVPRDEWTLDDDRVVLDADGKPYDADEVVYIPGPHEGLLTFGARTVRGAADLERSWLATARAPFRLELHQTTDEVLTKLERAELVGEAKTALAENGGVLFTNVAIEAKVHPVDSAQLFVEGRNAAAVDAARHVSVPAALIDATNAGASLTYETTAGRNAEFVDYGLSLYAGAVAARLSGDDVVPHGQRVAFDLADYTTPTPAPTGPPAED